jgi:hypothetical protein
VTMEIPRIDWEAFRRQLLTNEYDEPQDERWHPVSVETINEQVINDALAITDRCDRCGSEAWVRWVRDDQHILTCAHHARAHEEALLEWAHYSIDKRKDRFAVDR